MLEVQYLAIIRLQHQRSEPRNPKIAASIKDGFFFFCYFYVLSLCLLQLYT